MPDQRKHRGPHPEDASLFAPGNLPQLRQATSDLSWLLSRGYATPSSLKLVGDRYELNVRQRSAVARCACSDESQTRRQQQEVPPSALAGAELWIDGYNVLTSLEAALSGGAILHARDGCYRDLASMHGSYRKVAETLPAIHLLQQVLESLQVESCRWLLDQPVSNSGRLKKIILSVAAERGSRWEVELLPDPDAVLKDVEFLVASADSQILDAAPRWFNLARYTIDAWAQDRTTGELWLVDLST